MAESVCTRAPAPAPYLARRTKTVRYETGYPPVLRHDLAVAAEQLERAIEDAGSSSVIEQRLLRQCQSPIVQLVRDLSHCPVNDDNTAEFLLVLPDALATQGGRETLSPSRNALVLVERAQSTLEELVNVGWASA